MECARLARLFALRFCFFLRFGLAIFIKLDKTIRFVVWPELWLGISTIGPLIKFERWTRFMIFPGNFPGKPRNHVIFPGIFPGKTRKISVSWRVSPGKWGKSNWKLDQSLTNEHICSCNHDSLILNNVMNLIIHILFDIGIRNYFIFSDVTYYLIFDVFLANLCPRAAGRRRLPSA